MKKFLTSHLGKKIIMAVTGLGLFGFLIGHVSGNMLMFVSRDAFNDYAHMLISNPFIYVAEAGLIIMFVMHAVSGISVTRANRAARPEAYKAKKSAGGASRQSFASRSMILSGLVLLIFVPLHIKTFKYGPVYTTTMGTRDLYQLVHEIFEQPLYVAWYVASLVIIGFHLWHGFGSAFESLGVRYRDRLRQTGQILAVLITFGFILIPTWIYVNGGGML